MRDTQKQSEPFDKGGRIGGYPGWGGGASGSGSGREVLGQWHTFAYAANICQSAEVQAANTLRKIGGDELIINLLIVCK